MKHHFIVENFETESESIALNLICVCNGITVFGITLEKLLCNEQIRFFFHSDTVLL